MLGQASCPRLARSVTGCAHILWDDKRELDAASRDDHRPSPPAQAWRAVLPDVRHRQATADPQEQELNAVTYLRQVLGPSPNPSKMFLLNDVAGLCRCQSMDINHAGPLPGIVKILDTGSRSTSLSPPGYHTSEGVTELDRRATDRWRSRSGFRAVRSRVCASWSPVSGRDCKPRF